ncbi:MAG TPA: transporter substrate-binding domain-containing protein [Vicinamibacteria bacterium]
MKKTLLAGLAALAAFGAARSEAGDLAEVTARGALKVLVVDGSPEFYKLKPHADPGLEREILDGFARLHKLKIETLEIPSWSALVPALLEGKGDLIAGSVTVTEGRLKIINFTHEVFPTRNVAVTRQPHPAITSLEQLRAARVGTIKGTSLAEAVAAAAVPPAQVDDSFPSGGLPDGLKRGRITAAVIGLEAAVLAHRDDPELQLGLFVGPRQSLAFGVRKEDKELTAALDTYISNLRKTPTWSRLVVKYFGDTALDVLKRAEVE